MGLDVHCTFAQSILTYNFKKGKMKNSTPTTVSVIGLGNVGKAIVTNLALGQHPVIVASRDFRKAKDFADTISESVIAKEITEAMKEADVIIPAIGFSDIKEFLTEYASELSDKIIIDVSNPIVPDGKGGFKKVIGEHESAAKVLSGLILHGAKLVKAFGTLGVGTLKSAAFDQSERKTLFYATDSTNSQPQIEELILDSGFEPLHIGGIDQSIRIEVFGDLHEFGNLGKAVSLAEAKIATAQSKHQIANA